MRAVNLSMNRKRIALTAMLSLACVMAHALDPSRAISQYAHTAWRSQDGYFAGAPTAITQTKDGYIWVGTTSGLLRFDGVRFIKWAPNDADHVLPASYIVSLLGSTDGSLWIGTGFGLSHLTNGTLENFSETKGYINSVIENGSGVVWASRTRDRTGSGPVCRIEKATKQCYGQKDGIAEPFGEGLALDAGGNLWVGSEGALVKWKSGLAQVFHPRGASKDRSTASVDALAISPDQTIWVGLSRSGPGLGLQQLVDGAWRELDTPFFDPSSLRVSSLLLDQNGSLWVGTFGDGIYRIRGTTVEHFGASEGLSDDTVHGLSEDREHNIWVATGGGIDSFRDLAVVTYHKQQGIIGTNVNSVLAGPDGSIWIGVLGALERLRDGVISSIRKEDGLPGALVGPLLVDHKGRLWVGIDHGLYVYESGRFKPILDAQGRNTDVVVQLAEDVSGSIWAMQQSRRNRLLVINHQVISAEFAEPSQAGLTADPHGGVWIANQNAVVHVATNGIHHTLPMPSDVQLGPIQDMVAEADGTLWAVAKGGVLRFAGDKVQTLGSDNGLPCPSYGAAIFDDSGALWLDQKCGIVKIDRASLLEWIKHPDAHVQTITFGVFDGVESGFTPVHPSAAHGIDDRLWFANGSKLQMLDPNHLHFNALPPPVHIEQIIADHKNVTLASVLRIPPLTRDLEVDYTALSFVMPQQVMFRYKLEGHDTEWQEAGTRRAAFYTDLKPGAYQFRVSASNNNGIWNEAGTVLKIDILPMWYQTWWFGAIVLSAAILLLCGLYFLRMRVYTAALRLRFDERLDERTQIARNLHDTLLQTIQGSKLVADQARASLADAPSTEMYLSRLSEWLERASREGRDALESLRSAPTLSEGLVENIRSYIEESKYKSDTKVRFTIKGTARAIHPIVSHEIYWISHEAIGNALRHSCAQHIDIELRYERNLTLQVTDSGKGIGAETLTKGRPHHFGILGMRERAARIKSSLKITTNAGVGTQVSLHVPGTIAFS